MLSSKKRIIYLVIFIALFFCSLFSVHIRIKTTILGYKIGKLKAHEAQLLINKSLLTMELSKITAKNWLINFLEKPEKQKNGP